jgi:dihydrofolate reductase
MGHEYPGADKNVIVISRTIQPEKGSIRYYAGSLKALIADMKSKEGKNIFCDGGAEIVNELLKDNLIDEFIISIIPVLLGDGVRLFKKGGSEINLKLVSSIRFDKGLVQLKYIKTGSAG